MIIDKTLSQATLQAGDAILIAPAPTGVAATDFAALRDFFNGAPAGARLMFLPGAVYPVFAGACRAKPGQIIDLNGAVIQRAPEVVAKTVAPLANGATQVQVDSVTGLQVGMAVNLLGASVGDSTNILQACLQTDNNQALTILSIDVDSNGVKTVTFEGPVFGVTSTVTGSAGGTLAAGAVLAPKGPLLDACSWVAGGAVTIVNGVIDGNRRNNATNNRWESTVDLRVNSTGGFFENFTISNSAGEGVVTNGNHPVFNNFRFSSLNGNLVHFNGWSVGTKLSQIDGDTFNLDYTVGHANGGIIASNNTYQTIVDGFDLRNGRLFGIGSFDQSDNAFAKISNGFIADCWGGGLGLFGSNLGAASGLDVRNVRIANCGTSYLGIDVTGSGSVARARHFDIDLVLVDSMIAISGLADSRVKIRSYHSDTARLTPVNAAAGRATNYAGKINGSSFKASSSLNLGADLGAQVELSVCENTQFDVVQVDGASAPLASTYGIRTTYATDAGGPWLNCTFNLDSKGGSGGVQLYGVMRNCRGLLRSADITRDSGVFLFLRSNSNRGTAFPGPGLGVVAAALTAPGAGGSTIRTQYPLAFSGGGMTVPAIGSFIVEGGALRSIQIDRAGVYASAPVLDFSAAPGLSGAAATAVLGMTQDYSVSDNNDFTVDVQHAFQPAGTNLLRLRQDSSNSAGCGWSIVRGKVCAAGAAGGAGITDMGAPLHHLHLNDLEARGPSTNWNELSLAPAAAPNLGRLSNVRSTRSSYTAPANWALEPGATATTAVRVIAA
jgi:hypothetical protein